MIKKLSLMSLMALIVVALSACGKTEEERLIEAQADMLCYTQEAIKSMAENPDSFAGDMEKKAEEIAKDNGFESSQAIQDVFMQYQDKQEEMLKKAEELAGKQCGFAVPTAPDFEDMLEDKTEDEISTDTDLIIEEEEDMADDTEDMDDEDTTEDAEAELEMPVAAEDEAMEADETEATVTEEAETEEEAPTEEPAT